MFADAAIRLETRHTDTPRVLFEPRPGSGGRPGGSVRHGRFGIRMTDSSVRFLDVDSCRCAPRGGLHEPRLWSFHKPGKRRTQQRREVLRVRTRQREEVLADTSPVAAGGVPSPGPPLRLLVAPAHGLHNPPHMTRMVSPRPTFHHLYNARKGPQVCWEAGRKRTFQGNPLSRACKRRTQRLVPVGQPRECLCLLEEVWRQYAAAFPALRPYLVC